MMSPSNHSPWGTLKTRATAAALLLAALTTLTACDAGTSEKTATHDKPSATASAKAKHKGLTAKQAAAELADATGVTSLGHPADNTSACSNKAAGKEPNKNDCAQLITTDTVSIYEFRTPVVAAHWAETMKAQGDWRPIGRFALAWTARDQKLTSDERRGELTTAMQKIVESE